MKFPFMFYANRFLRHYSNIYLDVTKVVLYHRFKRQEEIFTNLKEMELVTTVNPRHMTVDDVKRFYDLLVERGFNYERVSNELGSLHELCMYAGHNHAVEEFECRFLPDRIRTEGVLE